MDFDEARRAFEGGADPVELATLLVEEMNEEERLSCLDGGVPFWAGLTDIGAFGYHRRPFPAFGVDRLGIDGFFFSDGPRGVVVDHATCFPVSMGRGASFDPALEEEIGEVIGAELRAVGATLYGGVCVNVLRHPAWGRAQETYGEDPHHVGEMGVALVRGVQRHAMACVKHFAANSMENARFVVDVEIDEVALHEVYLPHFRHIVESGVASVMSAYNKVNGSWCGESHELLTEILRDEWGFEGFVISDWIFGLRDGPSSVLGGLNVEMPYKMIRSTSLRAALDDGRLSWSDIDALIVPIVATLLRFAATLSTPAPDRSILARPAHRALARRAAAAAAVLLKNEAVDGAPLLPIDTGSLSTLALLGPLADSINLGDGGSSDVWADAVVTVADGLREVLGSAQLLIDDGSSPAAAAALAASADLAVVVVGFTKADEGEYLGNEGMEHLGELFPGPDDPLAVERFEAYVAAAPPVSVPERVAERGSSGFTPGGDRSSLRLAEADLALIKAVVEANPRCVIVLEGGSAILLSDIDERVPAIMHAWYPGVEGGRAIADLLSGAVEPSGRLPLSIPSDEAHLPAFDPEATSVTYDRWHGWWHLEHEGHRADYPFGFGLSYTSFELGDVAVSPGEADLLVSAELRNSGERPGRPLLLVSSQRLGDDVPRRLVGFGRCDLEPGEVAVVELTIPLARLNERDTERHEMLLRPGRYRIVVGQDADDVAAAVEIEI